MDKKPLSLPERVSEIRRRHGGSARSLDTHSDGIAEQRHDDRATLLEYVDYLERRLVDKRIGQIYMACGCMVSLDDKGEIRHPCPTCERQICTTCGRSGHWSADCPDARKVPPWEEHPELYECATCSAKLGAAMLCSRCYKAREQAGGAWVGERR